MAAVLNAAVGRTIPTKRLRNVAPPGSWKNTRAEPKNINPEISVPIAVNVPAVKIVWLYFFINSSIPKKTNAVIGLSIKLGICPEGNPVVKAEIIPVNRPTNKTFFPEGNSNIPKNIIVSIKSGFIPKSNGGVTACSTAPIPTNNDSKTSTLVFISHLSYSNYAHFFEDPPIVLYAYCENTHLLVYQNLLQIDSVNFQKFVFLNLVIKWAKTSHDS